MIKEKFLNAQMKEKSNRQEQDRCFFSFYFEFSCVYLCARIYHCSRQMQLVLLVFHITWFSIALTETFEYPSRIVHMDASLRARNLSKLYYKNGIWWCQQLHWNSSTISRFGFFCKKFTIKLSWACWIFWDFLLDEIRYVFLNILFFYASKLDMSEMGPQ